MSKTTDGRRFGGIGRLYGEDALKALQASHVTVVGLGGVGSWATEALVRSGVGHVTLIDGDRLELSNTNRQLPAVEGNYGKLKAEALKARLLQINPECRIDTVAQFLNAENIDTLLPVSDWVIDCIDDLKGKAALLAVCRDRGVRAVSAGGAGARTDPGSVRVSDLARVKGDPLMGKLRTMLRKEYGFPAGSADGRSELFGITVVYSDQPLRQPQADSVAACGAEPGARIGFGAGVVVTGTAGLRLASEVINGIAADGNTKA